MLLIDVLQLEGTPGKPLGATTSEGVLANFFNSLLSKKTGAGGAPGGSPGGAGTSPGTRGGGSPQPDDCKFQFIGNICSTQN